MWLQERAAGHALRLILYAVIVAGYWDRTLLASPALANLLVPPLDSLPPLRFCSDGVGVAAWLLVCSRIVVCSGLAAS